MATTAECKAFINSVAPVIVKYAKVYGFKVASPIIAQACLESGYGASAISKPNNGNGWNMFGMKAGSSWKGKVQNMPTYEQNADGSYIHIRSNFRGYSSLDEGIKGYFEFITGYSRYKNAIKQTTPRGYLQAIKDAGYATSLKYVDNNMNVVNKWNLTQYDAELNAPSDGIAVPTIRKGTRGENARCLQKNLNAVLNCGLVEDGIIGVLSEAQIVEFQKMAFPNEQKEWDGIYGKKTYAKMKEKINE